MRGSEGLSGKPASNDKAKHGGGDGACDYEYSGRDQDHANDGGDGDNVDKALTLSGAGG